MPVLLKSLQGVGHAIHVNTKLNKKLNEDSTLDIDIVKMPAHSTQSALLQKCGLSHM